jgi:hypothetical protein
MEPADENISGHLRTLQIVYGAMLVGPLVFLSVIALVFHQQGRSLVLDGPLPPVTLTAFVVLPVAAAGSPILSAVALRSTLRSIALGTWQPPPGARRRGITADALSHGHKLMAARMTADILRLAPLQGATFVACIALFVEGRVWALVAAGVGWLLMLARFPTEVRIRSWLDEQGERLDLPRQQSPPANSSD